MRRPRCESCDATADLVDNYDTLQCWDCWDDGCRDKPHNLVFQVLRNRDGRTVGDNRGVNREC